MEKENKVFVLQFLEGWIEQAPDLKTTPSQLQRHLSCKNPAGSFMSDRSNRKYDDWAGILAQQQKITFHIGSATFTVPLEKNFLQEIRKLVKALPLKCFTVKVWK